MGLIKTLGGAVVIGAAAIWAAEKVQTLGSYTNASSDNARLAYKYGAGGVGALAGGILVHLVFGK